MSDRYSGILLTFGLGIPMMEERPARTLSMARTTGFMPVCATEGQQLQNPLLSFLISKLWAGTEFVYPQDFIPCINAVVGFNLAPGASTVVKARFPRAFVPPAGTHGCLLAAVYTPSSDLAIAGRQVWEHNNLAQKNLTVIDLLPNASIIIPFHLGNLHLLETRLYTVEVRRPDKWPNLSVSLVNKRSEVITRLFTSTKATSFVVKPEKSSSPIMRFLDAAKVEIVQRGIKTEAADTVRIDVAKDSVLELSAQKDDKSSSFLKNARTDEAIKSGADLVKNGVGTAAITFKPGLLSGFQIAMSAASQVRLDLKLTAPPD